ncbi:unnamed protein product [Somion occarium]|uniref:Uncharacterized protein n=1 Tax=Somion occarium TaxID=3059160 RepID=A0ABP1ECN7_9APHY
MTVVSESPSGMHHSCAVSNKSSPFYCQSEMPSSYLDLFYPRGFHLDDHIFGYSPSSTSLNGISFKQTSRINVLRLTVDFYDDGDCGDVRLTASRRLIQHSLLIDGPVDYSGAPFIPNPFSVPRSGLRRKLTTPKYSSKNVRGAQVEISNLSN